MAIRQKFFDYRDRRQTAISVSFFDSIAKKISLNKSISIGIDIGLECLRFIKTTRTSDNTPILLDFKCVSFPPQTYKHTREFEDFLQSELLSFCGPKKRYNLWTIMPTAHIDVRHIRIPKTAKISVEKAVYWAIKKESAFNEAESIFDFEVQGEVTEKDNTKLLIMVYTAPIKEVKEIQEMFVRIGMPLTGISITPFGVENIFRSEWVPNLESTNAVLFIGNDFSRIDIYFQGNLVLTRDIKAGTKSNIESLIDAFSYRKHSLSKVDDTSRIDDSQARKILFSLSQDSPPLAEKDIGSELKEQEIFEMILPAIRRLVRQTERTIEYYESNPGTEKVDKIYVSGVMNVYRPIMEYISNELGIKGGILDPLSSQALCKDISSVSERTAFTPALGIALSDSIDTPNLLCTHEDRAKGIKTNRINLGIFAVFITVVFICFCIFIYQRHSAVKKKTTIAGIKQQLSDYKPRLDKDTILKMVDTLKSHQDILKAYSERYIGLAVVSELTTMTPTNVKITTLKAFLWNSLSTDKKKPGRGKKRANGKELVINGFVQGKRDRLETSLDRFLIKLQTSKVFSQVMLQEQKFVSSGIGKVLHFTIRIRIV